MKSLACISKDNLDRLASDGGFVHTCDTVACVRIGNEKGTER